MWLHQEGAAASEVEWQTYHIATSMSYSMMDGLSLPHTMSLPWWHFYHHLTSGIMDDHFFVLSHHHLIYIYHSSGHPMQPVLFRPYTMVIVQVYRLYYLDVNCVESGTSSKCRHNNKLPTSACTPNCIGTTNGEKYAIYVFHVLSLPDASTFSSLIHTHYKQPYYSGLV